VKAMTDYFEEPDLLQLILDEFKENERNLNTKISEFLSWRTR